MANSTILKQEALSSDFTRWTLQRDQQIAHVGDFLVFNEQRVPVVSSDQQCLAVVTSNLSPTPIEYQVQVQAFSFISKQIYLLKNSSIFLAPWLAEQIVNADLQRHSLILAECEFPWPFSPCPSRIIMADMPNSVTACIPLLEDKSIPSRLCHKHYSPGCFEGSADELLEQWLTALEPEQKTQWQVIDLKAQ